MQCQECFETFVGRRCPCGWSPPGQLTDGKRTYQGMTLCSWATSSKLCNMLACGDRPYCNWHTEWERLLEDAPMQSEFDALGVWMQQFEPGGDYGANPGQWHASPEDTIRVCHGIGYLKGRTERQKMERNREHWEMMKTLKKGCYSDKTQAIIARTSGEALQATAILEKHA